MRPMKLLAAWAALAGAAIGSATVADAHGFGVEYAFHGGAGDGAGPRAAPTWFRGRLYGTTVSGGAHNLGTVYALDPTTGAEVVVHSFRGGRHGAGPFGRLVVVGGKLYGTTWNGGLSNCAGGCGTLFRVDPTTGAERVVYAFKGGANGYYPYSGLFRVGSVLYGTTPSGGAPCQFGGCGTVFSFDTTTETQAVIYAFKGGPADGGYPYAGVIEAGGLLFGTTVAGGLQNCTSGCGTVFRLDPATGVETTIYAFKGGDDGYQVHGGVTMVGGVLYGTTYTGGSPDCLDGCGTVFSVDPANGTKTAVHMFQGPDGQNPDGDLIEVNGAIYGATSYGGRKNGTVYSLDPATGAETVLHTFRGGADGATPGAGVVYSGHSLFGTTSQGGDSANCAGGGCGTVFSLKP